MKLLIFLLLAVGAVAQTPIRGPVAKGNVDNSAATSAVTMRPATSAPSGACTVKGDTQAYMSTGTAQVWICTPTSGTSCPCTWVQATGSGGGGGSGILTGTTPPGSCTLGNIFLDTDYYNLSYCVPGGTWEQLPKLLSSSGNPNTTIPFGCDSVEEAGRFIKDTTAISAATSIYVCAASGSGSYLWQAVIGGSGGGGVSNQTDLQDLKVTNSTSVITIPAGLGPRFGNIVCPAGSAATQAMSSGSATVLISVAPDCSYQATSNSGFGASSNITTATGTTFPLNHFPLASCTMSSGVVGTCTDSRRAFGSTPLYAGSGVAFTPTSTGITISATGGGGTGNMAINTGTTLPATCNLGTDFFLDTTYWKFYGCPNQNTWELFGKFLSIAGVPSSVSPTTCDVAQEQGRFSINTTATTPDTSIYVCGATGSGQYGWRPIVNTLSASTSGDITLPMGSCNVDTGAHPTWGWSPGITVACEGQNNTNLTYLIPSSVGAYITHYVKLPRAWTGSGTITAVADVFQIDEPSVSGKVGKVYLYIDCAVPGSTSMSAGAAFFINAPATTGEFTIPVQSTIKEVSFGTITVPAACTTGQWLGVALQRENNVLTSGTNLAFPLHVTSFQLRFN